MASTCAVCLVRCASALCAPSFSPLSSLSVVSRPPLDALAPRAASAAFRTSEVLRTLPGSPRPQPDPPPRCPYIAHGPCPLARSPPRGADRRSPGPAAPRPARETSPRHRRAGGQRHNSHTQPHRHAAARPPHYLLPEVVLAVGAAPSRRWAMALRWCLARHGTSTPCQRSESHAGRGLSRVGCITRNPPDSNNKQHKCNR